MTKMTESMPARRVVLDIETTGLSVADGDRIVEIAAVELLDDQISGRHIYSFVNPERDINPYATTIHGLTDEMLQDKPKFSELAASLFDFIRGAELIAHNSSFDIAFVEKEFALCGLGRVREHCPAVVDTLTMARQLRPNQSNTISALCAAYGVQSSMRRFQGALLDAYCLAEVYLALKLKLAE